MLRILSSSSHRRVKAKRLSFVEESVTDRQERVPGFDQAALYRASGVFVGAGGLNSEVGEGAARKGWGHMTFLDSDVVEPSNLNRQHFFRRDIYKNKAFQLARNLAAHASCGTVFDAYALHFEDALVAGTDLSGDVVICGIDNSKGRVAVSGYYREMGIPVIFIAVDYVAEHGYCFVQEPGQACFGCAFPNCLEPRHTPCRTPACKDILKVMAGMALYAADTLLMDRKRSWNFRNVHLAGFAPSGERLIEKRDDCPLCGAVALDSRLNKKE